MKQNLFFLALSMVFASPLVSAKTEIEILRSKCAEQERQIKQLEVENSKLRNVPPPSQTIATPQTTTATAPKAEVAAPAVAEETATATYIVKAGDSLEKIARTVGTTPSSIAKQNGMKPTALIHPGQKLKIRKASNTTSTPSSVASAAPTAVDAGKTYTVKNGETFSSISRKLKIPLSALIAANPKVKPTAIRAGQVINLSKPKPVAAAPQVASSTEIAPPAKPAALATPAPTPVSQSARPPLEAAVPKPQPAPAPAPVAENQKAIRPVTIDGEMTYGDFAAKHGTDSARLNSLNGLDLNDTTLLAKGSELYVPTAQ